VCCRLPAQPGGSAHCCPPPVRRLLHLFAARGLRWAAYAAAEMLQVYTHLDIREHKGKVRAGGPDGQRRGQWEPKLLGPRLLSGPGEAGGLAG
jgi:hypothetical protein